MMNRIATFATAAAAVTAVLSASTASAFWGNRVIGDFIDDAYEPTYVSAFAAAGAPTAIYGTTRDGASAEAIAADTRLPAFFAPRQISAGPTGERSGYHLVLVFNPVGTTPKEACRGEATGGTPGAQLKVMAVFCSSFNRPVSEAILLADGSPTPGDGEFSRAMGQLLNKVTPPVNPRHGEGPFRRR